MLKFMNAGAVELRAAVASCRAAFLGVAVFSGLINLLAMTSSIYLLQLYDRVIPSHSVPTLVGLPILMLWLFAGYGVLDTVRSRVISLSACASTGHCAFVCSSWYCSYL